jgi:hypothetical protein
MNETPERYAGWSEEVWVYGGITMSAKGHRRHMWIDEQNVTSLYPDTGDFVIGGKYRVYVNREEEAKSRSVPVYTGHKVEPEECARLQAADIAMRARLTERRKENSDKGTADFDAVIDPLVALCRKLPSYADKYYLVGYVLRKMLG